MITLSFFLDITNVSAVRYSGTTSAMAALKVQHGDLPSGITPLLKQEVIPSERLQTFTRIKTQLENELALIATRHSQLGWMIDPALAEQARVLIKTAKAEYDAERDAFLADYPAICDSVLQNFYDNCNGHPACADIVNTVRESQPSLSYIEKGVNFSIVELPYELIGEQAMQVMEGLRARAIADMSRWASEGLRAKSPAASYKKVSAIQSKLDSFGYYSTPFKEMADKFRPIFEEMGKNPSTSYAETKLTSSDLAEMRKHSAYLKSFVSAKELLDFVEGETSGIEYISSEVRQQSLIDMVQESQSVIDEELPVKLEQAQESFFDENLSLAF